MTVLKVQVTSADVTQDKIGLTLSPGNLSGNLRLELIGPGITHTIRYVTRPSGTYNETFDIPNLPEKEFLTVRASWEISGAATLGTLNYHFRKLGTYRHSQYNVPRESACGGSASNVYIITLLSGCFNNYVSTTLRSDLVSQTNINGTGISLNYGTLKALAATSCNSATQNRPPDAAGKTFVQVSSITGSCNTTLTSLSLARCTNNPIVPLACSDRICIKGLEGIKTIADSCPACCSWPEQKQLDNFNAEKNVCQNQNGSIYDLGNFVTFKLY